MTALDHTNGPFLNPCSRLDLSPVRPQINPVCRSPRQSSQSLPRPVRAPATLPPAAQHPELTQFGGTEAQAEPDWVSPALEPARGWWAARQPLGRGRPQPGPASRGRKRGSLARGAGRLSLPAACGWARAAGRHGALQLQEDYGGAVRQGNGVAPPSPPLGAGRAPPARRRLARAACEESATRPALPAWPRPSPPAPPAGRVGSPWANAPGPGGLYHAGGVWMGVGVGVPVREGHCGLRRDPGAAFLHRPAGVSGWSLQKSPVFQPRVMLSLIPARSFQMKFSPSLNEGAFVKSMVREAPRGVLGLLCFVGICHVTARAAAVAAVDGRPTLSQLK